MTDPKTAAVSAIVRQLGITYLRLYSEPRSDHRRLKYYFVVEKDLTQHGDWRRKINKLLIKAFGARHGIQVEFTASPGLWYGPESLVFRLPASLYDQAPF